MNIRHLCLLLLVLTRAAWAAPITDAELDRFLDQIPLEAALIIDQNDTLRRVLATDANLRQSLSNLKERDGELMDFVKALNTRHAASSGHAPRTLWETEYSRFLEVRRNTYSTNDEQAIRTWTNGIVNTWSPGARRRIVSKVRAERDRHQAAYAQTRGQIPGVREREVAARNAIPGLEVQAAEQNRQREDYLTAHARWNNDDWFQFGRNTAIAATVGAVLPGAIAKYMVEATARGSWITAAVGAVVAGGIVALITRSSIDDTHKKAAGAFASRAQAHNRQIAEHRATLQSTATRIQELRDRAAQQRREAVWHDQLQDVIPNGRLWDRGLPAEEPEGPNGDDIQRTFAR